MKNLRIFGLIAMSALIFTACEEDNEDQDTTAPVIQSATINEKDHDIMVMAGEELHIDAHLTDNEALGELKIDMHDIFDGHEHKSSTFKWSEVMTIALSGKEQHLHEHTEVPEVTTAGPYHAIFRVIDEEGNEGEFVELDFMIGNASQPVIEITSPDFSDEVHAPKGSTLSLTGTVSDETDLAEILVKLEEEHEHNHIHEQRSGEGEIYEKDFDLTGSADLNWSFDGNVDIAIPADAETGHYKLKVTAIDNVGNMSIFEGEVHIM